MREEFEFDINEWNDQNQFNSDEIQFQLDNESYQNQAIAHRNSMDNFRKINKIDQENIKSCIKYVIKERQIKFKCYHYRKEENESICINFNNFAIDKIILKYYRNISVNFDNCKIDIIEFSDNNMYNIRDSYCLFGSHVQVIDYSQCNFQSFDLYKLPDRLDACLLILPEQVNIINISTGIQNIKLQSYNFLESLNLECQPQIYCENDEKDDKIMNLQKFTKLVEIRLKNIESDILLPNKLKSLYLLSSSQHKILNTEISSQDIYMHKLNLLNVQVLEYNQLKLYYCTIYDLILRPNQDLQYIRNNKIENLIVDSEQEEINLQNNEIKNLVFKNKNMKILNLKGFTNILVDSSQESTNKIQQEKLNDCIDFSKFQMLHEITIETSKYFRSLDNYMLCPTQLYSIILINSYTLQPKENTIFDFSKLLNLQNVEIIDFKIKNIIMYQNKLKFEFDPKFLTSMQIESLDNIEQGYSLFINFIKNVNSLTVKGLKNLIIEDKLENVINFKAFENLEVLEVENIQKQILFPKFLTRLKIENSKIVQFQYNFDFSNFEMLQSILLQYCIVDKFITKPDVKCTIHHCDINYLSIPFLCTYDYSFGKNTTVIKTFQQQAQQKILTFFDKNEFEPSYERQKFNFKIQTLIINEPQTLQKLTVCGMEQIIVKDHKSSGILDFTNFTQLTEMQLINMKCTGIVFGHAQKQIKLFQQDGESKIEFLDFRNCQGAESSQELQYEIENVNVDIMYLGDHHIKHYDCSFKYVQVWQSKSNLNSLCEISENYKGYCKYLVVNDDDSKQRILYQINCYNSELENLPKLYISQGMLLAHKLDYLYRMINQIILE